MSFENEKRKRDKEIEEFLSGWGRRKNKIGNDQIGLEVGMNVGEKNRKPNPD